MRFPLVKPIDFLGLGGQMWAKVGARSGLRGPLGRLGRLAGGVWRVFGDIGVVFGGFVVVFGGFGTSWGDFGPILSLLATPREARVLRLLQHALCDASPRWAEVIEDKPCEACLRGDSIAQNVRSQYSRALGLQGDVGRQWGHGPTKQFRTILQACVHRCNE